MFTHCVPWWLMAVRTVSDVSRSDQRIRHPQRDDYNLRDHPRLSSDAAISIHAINDVKLIERRCLSIQLIRTCDLCEGSHTVGSADFSKWHASWTLQQ